MAKKSGSGTTLLIVALVGIPAVIAFIGILAAIAIPAFMGYIQRSKAAEARTNVMSIHSALAATVVDQGLTEAPRIARTPLDVGCGKTIVDWSDPGWSTIGFGPPDPLFYAYEVEPLPGGAYVIRATGDLDCDGTYSTFELRGHIDPTTGEAVRDGDIVVTDELE